jgi:NAD-dependent SIR2 family protein deacetylase
MSASGDLTIAVCDRCKTKMPYKRLRADGNTKGLRVCPECWDEKDPYRLPARKTEQLTLSKPRPDVQIPATTDFLIAEDGSIITTEQDDYVTV